MKECYNRRNAKCSVSSYKQKKIQKDRETQDSDVSSEIDNDEEIDAEEIKEEDWVEYIKRSTNEATEKMEYEKIRCWKMTQRKMKWRLAMRIATSPNERWLIKAAEWNPELSSKYRTNKSIGRPRKRWEDEAAAMSTKIGSTQQKTAEDGLYSRKTTQTNSDTRTRRNSHNIPAKYVTEVKLSDEEIADIT